MNRRRLALTLARTSCLIAFLFAAVLLAGNVLAVDLPWCPPTSPNPNDFAQGELICDRRALGQNGNASTATQRLDTTNVRQSVVWGVDKPRCLETRFTICRGYDACIGTSPQAVLGCDKNGCWCPQPDGSLQRCGTEAGDTITGSFLDDGATVYTLVAMQNFGQCGDDVWGGRTLKVVYYRGQDRMDDSCAVAGNYPVDFGESVVKDGRLEFGGDQDWLSFNLTSARNIRLFMDVGPGDVDLELYDRCDHRIAWSTESGAADEEIEIFLKEGTYFIRIFGKDGQTGEYPSLDLLADAPDTSPPVFDPHDPGTIVPETPKEQPMFVTVTVNDTGSGLKEIRPQRDPYCATCIPSLDGADCAGTRQNSCPAGGAPPAYCGLPDLPICTKVTWSPFTPGTNAPVAVKIEQGPGAAQDPYWYFGTHLDVWDMGQNYAWQNYFYDLNLNRLLSHTIWDIHYDHADGRAEVVYFQTTRFTNRSEDTLRNLFLRTAALEYTDGSSGPPPVLLNADGGPGGIDSRISVPGEIRPQASFTVTFEIGLPRAGDFRFMADAFGVRTGNVTGSSLREGAGAASFEFEIRDDSGKNSATPAAVDHLYLPGVER